MINITLLEQFPPGNPFCHDLFRMGSVIGTNCVVMYKEHTSKKQPYIIVCNTETGERVQINLSAEGEGRSQIDDKIGEMINEAQKGEM